MGSKGVVAFVWVILIGLLSGCFLTDLFTDDGVIPVYSDDDLDPYLQFKATIDYTKMAPDREDSLGEVRPVLIWHMVGDFNHYYPQNISEYTVDSSGVYHFTLKQEPIPDIFNDNATAIAKLWFFENSNGSNQFTLEDMYHPDDRIFVDTLLVLEKEIVTLNNQLREFSHYSEDHAPMAEADVRFFLNYKSGVMWQEYNDIKDTLITHEIAEGYTELINLGALVPKEYYDLALIETRAIYQQHNKYEAFVFDRQYDDLPKIDTTIVNDSVSVLTLKGEQGRLHPNQHYLRSYITKKNELYKKRMAFDLKSRMLHYLRTNSSFPYEDTPLDNSRPERNSLVAFSFEFFFFFIQDHNALDTIVRSVNKGYLSIDTQHLTTGYNLMYADRYSRVFNGLELTAFQKDSVLIAEHGQTWREYQPNLSAYDPVVDQEYDFANVTPFAGVYYNAQKNLTVEVVQKDSSCWLSLEQSTAEYFGLGNVTLFNMVPTKNEGTFKSSELNNLVMTLDGNAVKVSYLSVDKTIIPRSVGTPSLNDTIEAYIAAHQTLSYVTPQVDMVSYRGSYSNGGEFAINISPDDNPLLASGGFVNNILSYSLIYEDNRTGQTPELVLHPIGLHRFYSPSTGLEIEFHSYNGSDFYKLVVIDQMGGRSFYNKKYTPLSAQAVQDLPHVGAGQVMISSSGKEHIDAWFDCDTYLYGGVGVVESLYNSGEESWYVDDLEDYLLLNLAGYSGQFQLTIESCIRDGLYSSIYFKVLGGSSLNTLTEIQHETAVSKLNPTLFVDAIAVESENYYIKITPVNSLGFMPWVAFSGFTLKQ
ncbi:MAG: hypothetical protein OCC49_07110 [Fibrobacterales bacterium]